MPRFQIAGTKENVLPQFQARALEQGGDRGYNEHGRKRMEAVNETVQKALQDIPGDANLSIAGSVDATGTSIDIVLEIHANHPSLGTAVQSVYTEPGGIHQPDGSRGVHPNADERDQAEVDRSFKQTGSGAATAAASAVPGTPGATPGGTTVTTPGSPATPADGGFPARGTESGFVGAHPAPTGRGPEG